MNVITNRIVGSSGYDTYHRWHALASVIKRHLFDKIRNK